MEGQDKDKKKRGAADKLQQVVMLSRTGAVAKGAAAGILAAGAPVIIAIIGIMIIVIVVFLIVILLGAGSAPTVHAFPGDGLRLKDNYCQAFLSPEDLNGDGESNDCSQVLKVMIESAAAWAKMPAGVLNGIGLSENLGDVMVMTEADIQSYSQPGAAMPSCALSGDGARGPMQFMPGTWDQGGALPVRYKDAVNVATGGSRTPEICNIMDSIYAAAWKLKCDVTPVAQASECISGNFSTYDYNDSTDAWEKDEEVFPAARAYLGRCVDPRFPDVDYCENVWQFYQNKMDEGVAGDPDSPLGRCPVEGEITSRFGPGHTLGVDISNGGGVSVLAPISGEVITVGDMGAASYGVYVVIVNPQYQVLLAHFVRGSVTVSEGDFVSAGEALGIEDSTGHSSGDHVHYEVSDSSGRINPEPFLPVEVIGGVYHCVRGAPTGVLP